jgi:hypothetical protein
VPPDPAGINTLSHRQHPPGSATTGHIGRSHGKEVLAPATPQQRVEVDDVSGTHPDHDLPGTGDRFGYLLLDQHLGPTELAYLDRAHHNHIP